MCSNNVVIYPSTCMMGTFHNGVLTLGEVVVVPMIVLFLAFDEVIRWLFGGFLSGS